MFCLEFFIKKGVKKLLNKLIGYEFIIVKGF